MNPLRTKLLLQDVLKDFRSGQKKGYIHAVLPDWVVSHLMFILVANIELGG